MGCGLGVMCASVPAYALWPFGGKQSAGADADDIIGRVFKGDAPETVWKWSREASFYQNVDGSTVRCGICPHRCMLAPGDRSVCRSRVNVGGKLYSLVYGNPCAVHVDPIEKKPLYHFKPASRAFSIATTGCNLRCLNCQNWEISQAKPREVRHVELFPDQVVSQAIRTGCASIAYTYSEPVTFYEYTRETAQLAREAGIANVLVSAGYINRAPLLDLCRWIDAANVNLKSFSDEIYRKLNGARLQPILNTFQTLNEQGVHFEMTNLVVPGYVDDPDMVRRMCAWILEQLGQDHPLHFTRFFPKYKLNRLAPTPVSTLERFRELAMAEGIRYVYVGNVPGHSGNHTYCHNCGKCIVERQGYFITANHLESGRCRFCGTTIPGVWS
jgi:pyruvate formate lyase activating enzyme